MITQIGTVSIEYNKEGGVIDSAFKPAMEITLDEELTHELKTIECCNDAETLEHNASLVLASFFNRMNKIELRDIATTKLEGHIDHLEQYEDGKIHKATISYTFDDGK